MRTGRRARERGGFPFGGFPWTSRGKETGHDDDTGQRWANETPAPRRPRGSRAPRGVGANRRRPSVGGAERACRGGIRPFDGCHRAGRARRGHRRNRPRDPQLSRVARVRARAENGDGRPDCHAGRGPRGRREPGSQLRGVPPSVAAHRGRGCLATARRRGVGRDRYPGDAPPEGGCVPARLVGGARVGGTWRAGGSDGNPPGLHRAGEEPRDARRGDGQSARVCSGRGAARALFHGASKGSRRWTPSTRAPRRSLGALSRREP